MSQLTNEQIRVALIHKFGDVFTEWSEPLGMLTFAAPKDMNLKVLQFLYDEESLSFRFMTDLQAVHYPDRIGEELCVVYHLHNLRDNVRIRFKVYTDVQAPDVFSTTALFAAANFMERETYDFFGVNFVGHPNLIRVLNVDEMDYFPLRKEFPLEDQTRVDKDDEMFGR
ncbi:MAG TPA: NADH-quinone oxidoreductase subunit C [Ferruginibacter sp.]|nr:NADH-quinone oxidoreductase subunit C [Ferruginibacter sp.]HRO18459.1 NADH-quinone oxidoreductase subunit C [Ferruginibacter sp.]HRQ21313.1 NADH-quinone oxidoreductase subunit C [Ferruginibacter sp.]